MQMLSKRLFKRWLEIAREEGFSTALCVTYRHFLSLALRKTWEFWEKLGIHITPIQYYEPIPDQRDLRKRKYLWQCESELTGIDLNLDHALTSLRKIFPRFSREYKFPREATLVPFEFYISNGYFEAVDAEVAHCMVRYLLPKTVIEVGSGYSTYLLARACLLNQERQGVQTQLFVVDPNPNNTIRKGVPGVTTIRMEKAEDVELAFFSQLNAGDILFIDSTHVIRTGGDVNYLYLEVLPKLKCGVVVHMHDIFLPQEYPQEWIFKLRRSWSEQYLLQAFLTYNYAFEVLWPGSYMHLRYPQLLKAAFPSYT
jgi:hypothetical protein